jgi:hypothetical protein
VYRGDRATRDIHHVVYRQADAMRDGEHVGDRLLANPGGRRPRKVPPTADVVVLISARLVREAVAAQRTPGCRSLR